ncbi:hypothetical protein P8452_51263 [Trifolium repens]|nr:hypothetical protein P8452_51263 [Trifolium repens]
MLGEIEEGKTCPLTVLQEYCEDDGLPVRFTVSDGGGNVISEDISNVEIEFVNNKPNCANSSKWVVAENSFRFQTKWISIGSFEELGGETKIIDGVFQIKKQGLGYKFVFFSKLSKTYYDIRRFNDVDGRRLVAINFESKRYLLAQPLNTEHRSTQIYKHSEQIHTVL